MSNYSPHDYGESYLAKLCSFLLVNEAGNYDEERSFEHHESSFDESNSQIFKNSENSLFSSTSIKTHLLPEMNRKLKQWYYITLTQ
jgi:uncharacterized UPF0160 family protein